jgi:hypothetical protein
MNPGSRWEGTAHHWMAKRGATTNMRTLGICKDSLKPGSTISRPGPRSKSLRSTVLSTSCASSFRRKVEKCRRPSLSVEAPRDQTREKTNTQSTYLGSSLADTCTTIQAVARRCLETDALFDYTLGTHPQPCICFASTQLVATVRRLVLDWLQVRAAGAA